MSQKPSDIGDPLATIGPMSLFRSPRNQGSFAMNRFRSLLFVLTATALSAPAARSFAHDGPGAHTHQESPMAKAGREMAEAANNLWADLTPDQKLKAGFEFNDPLRYDWHFIPRPRKGLDQGDDGRSACLGLWLALQRPEPARHHQGRHDHEPGADPRLDREGEGTGS